MERIRIAIDCMGGDNAPEAPVAGAVDALAASSAIEVILIGKEEEIRKILSGRKYDADRLSVKNATEVIETAEHPVKAINSKKDSSMVIALKMVKNGEAEAVLSAGNSGALLVGGQAIVGRLPGVKRAPFGALIPTANGGSLLVDSGANVDCRPDMLLNFARLGSVYVSEVLGRKNPTVGLVNIGAEEEKGNALVKETMPLLREASDLNFVGSVEARDIPEGGVDIIVCDAFVGNVVIKMYEGVAKTMMKALQTGFKANPLSALGALMSLPSLKKSLKDFDVSQYGGAPLLGLKGLVMKTHGSAKAKEFTNSCLQTIAFARHDVVGKMQEALAAAAEKEEKKENPSA